MGCSTEVTLERMAFQSADSSPTPVSALQDSPTHLLCPPTLCWPVSPTLCLQVQNLCADGTSLRRGTLLTRHLHLLSSRVSQTPHVPGELSATSSPPPCLCWLLLPLLVGLHTPRHRPKTGAPPTLLCTLRIPGVACVHSTPISHPYVLSHRTCTSLWPHHGLSSLGGLPLSSLPPTPVQLS